MLVEVRSVCYCIWFLLHASWLKCVFQLNCDCILTVAHHIPSYTWVLAVDRTVVISQMNCCSPYIYYKQVKKINSLYTPWKRRDISLRILHLNTRWRWVVIFTPFPLHPWGKKPASNLKGDWAVHRADLDILERRELFTE